MKQDDKTKIVSTLWVLYVLSAALIGIMNWGSDTVWKYYGLCSIILILISYILYTVVNDN